MTPRSPGDKGYGAYWKKTMNAARLSVLKGQGTDGRLGGRAIHMVLKTYGEYIDNTSGECWPTQKALAVASGYSVTVVQRVQDWAIENGWLEVVAPAVPRVRGKRMRAVVPPTTSQSDSKLDTELPVIPFTNYRSVGQQLPVNTDRQTLSSNSQFELSQLQLSGDEDSNDVASSPWPRTSSQSNGTTASAVAPDSSAKDDRSAGNDPWATPTDLPPRDSQPIPVVEYETTGQRPSSAMPDDDPWANPPARNAPPEATPDGPWPDTPQVTRGAPD